MRVFIVSSLLLVLSYSSICQENPVARLVIMNDKLLGNPAAIQAVQKRYPPDSGNRFIFLGAGTQIYTTSDTSKSIAPIPGNGCPGPIGVKVGQRFALSFVNTSWWLRNSGAVHLEMPCECRSKKNVLEAFESYVPDRRNDVLFLLSAEPLSFRPPVLCGTRSRKTYRQLTTTGIGSSPGLLTQLQNRPNTVIISGRSRRFRISRYHQQLFIHLGRNDAGSFLVIELSNNNQLCVRRFVTIADSTTPVLAQTFCDSLLPPPPMAADTAVVAIPGGDSVTVPVSSVFVRAPWLFRALNGNNYRHIWNTPVRLKVWHIEDEHMHIEGSSGHHETPAVRMVDDHGEAWTLRSCNKNISKVIPSGFRGTVVEGVVADMVSAQNPFGLMVVPTIMNALQLPHATPRVVFVPNDTALGVYRPVFANTVCEIEQHKPSLNSYKTMSTEEAIGKIVDEHRTVDQEMYLKCRMVDFLVADFDRHSGQWSWGQFDAASGYRLYPIAKDRDQALYCNNGFIMDIARRGSYSFMVNFRKHIGDLRNYGRVAAEIDQLFLNQLDEHDWRAVVSSFANALTDSVFSEAVQHLPPEIAAPLGSNISQTLSSRRDAICRDALRYYRFLSRRVSVLGSNGPDIFRLSGNDSELTVSVTTKTGGAEPLPFYHRTFKSSVTKEIRLYGLAGNDLFLVDSNHSSISVQIIGGGGADSFLVQGARCHIADYSAGTDQVLASQRQHLQPAGPGGVHFSFDPLYNKHSLPAFSIALDEVGNFVAGAGYSATHYGFRKKNTQSIYVLRNFGNRGYGMNYHGQFENMWHNIDLLPAANLALPVAHYYFGSGNNTAISHPISYYDVRYNYLSSSLMLRKRLFSDKTLAISLGNKSCYYWYDPAANTNRILETDPGLKAGKVSQARLYSGLALQIQYSNLDNMLVPASGILWRANVDALAGITTGTSGYSAATSSIDLYEPVIRDNRLLAALHLGAGRIFSRNFEYFQALTLGGGNYLWGYRYDRFAGRSFAYGNAELKLKLAHINAYAIAGDFGILGFADAGRVWTYNESSHTWHSAFGGGLYFIPFNVAMISFRLGRSSEDLVYSAALGAQTTIVFQNW